MTISMKTIAARRAPALLMLGALTLLAGCNREPAPAANGVIQTKYPGQISAGGASSGAIMAATDRPTTDAIYGGGTPGIAGGAGGNTSGAEIGGATRETGQGPSSGTTTPSGVGALGGSPQSGDTGGATAPANAPAPTASNNAPQGPATRQTEGK